MDFFDFLGVLVGALVFLVLVFLVCDAWQKHQAQMAQKRYFESQKPKILAAMMLLEDARQQIPALAFQAINRQGLIGTSMQNYRLSDEMDRQFISVIDGCRMMFGDYVVRMALLNIGMERYDDICNDPVFNNLLRTRF